MAAAEAVDPARNAAEECVCIKHVPAFAIHIICSTSVALSFLIFSSKRRFQLAIISAGHLSMCDPQMAFVFLKRNKQRLYNWNSLSSVFLSGYSRLSLFQMTGHLLSINRPSHSTEKELQNEFQNRHCSLNMGKFDGIFFPFSWIFWKKTFLTVSRPCTLPFEYLC